MSKIFNIHLNIDTRNSFEKSGDRVKAYIDKYPHLCPRCNEKVSPNLKHASLSFNGDLELLFCCPSHDCYQQFISLYSCTGSKGVHGFYHYEFVKSAPINFRKRSFSKEIEDVSKLFSVIYNQAYETESLGFDQIAGIGYRKALEFLIKDYCTTSMNEGEKSAILHKNLTKVIKDDLKDPKIISYCEKAVWLGNDETHYVKKWADKEIKDLKLLLEVVISHFDSELKAKKLAASFNDD
jgi:hypothetical protein